MALSAATTWEVRSAGSNSSGGGFVAGASGTDRSMSDTAFANGTNLTVDASTNTDVTPDGHTPGAADVGNLIQITTTGGGAAFTVGFYQIASIQSGKWRLDRSPAATSSAGATWAIGGAIAAPGLAEGSATAGNDIWIKAGNYLCGSSSNVAGGRILLNVGGDSSSGRRHRIRGYNATRGDNPGIGSRPVLQQNANSIIVLDCNAKSDVLVTHISFSSNGFTGGTGLHLKNARAFARFCDAFDAGGTGFTTCLASTGGQTVFFGCYALNPANTGFAPQGRCLFCEMKGTATGFNVGASASLFFCTASGALTGFTGNAFIHTYFGCVASDCTTGFSFIADTAAAQVQAINCIAYGCVTGYSAGGNTSTVCADTLILNCAGGGNTTNYDAAFAPTGFIALSADPFVSRTTGNFALNSTAGGGAALRAAGYQSLQRGTVGYPDIGAAQHAEVVSGGGPSGMDGGIRQ